MTVDRDGKHVLEQRILIELRGLAKNSNNYRGLLALASDAFVIFAAVAVFRMEPWLYPISVILIGFRQRALANLHHDSAHFTIARNKVLNDAIGFLAGWSIFLKLHGYRNSHVKAHHVHLGDELKDPDMRNYLEQRLFDAKPDRLFLEHFVPRILGLRSPTIIMRIVRDSIPERGLSGFARDPEHLAFLIFWVLVISLLASFGLLLDFVLLWVVPFLSIYQGVTWFLDIAEHFPLTRISANELLMTRNRSGSLFERAFLGVHNENFHLTHHLYPGVPFWNLPRAHRVMMGDVAYRNANGRSGGVFSKGPRGEPSIVSLVKHELRLAQKSGCGGVTVSS